MQCPKCKCNYDESVDGNWPLDINGAIKEGGCQDCWEQECDDSWWRMIWAIAEVKES